MRECLTARDPGGFRFALPTLHLDSRLRGNDRTSAEGVFAGVMGHLSASPLSSPVKGEEIPSPTGVQREEALCQRPGARLSKEVQKKSPAGGLGVSPNLSFPQEWGTKGVEK